jgi:hypothetical protein
MKVIVRVSRLEYTEGVDYALIDIDTEDAKRILDARKAFRQLKAQGGTLAELRALLLTDYSPVFFDQARLGDEGEEKSDETDGIQKDLLTAEQRANLDSDGVAVVVPDDFKLYDDECPVETVGEQLVIREDGFGWMAFIDYTGEQIETWLQPYQLLNRVL